MRYDTLQDLIRGSQSSRRYFLSLPVELQCRLHEHDAAVHSAEDLHRLAVTIQRWDALAKLGDWE